MTTKRKQENVSEYERKRQENIQKNKDMLKLLQINKRGLDQQNKDEQSDNMSLNPLNTKVVKRKRKERTTANPIKRRKGTESTKIPVIVPTRTSRRLRGESANLTVPEISEDTSEAFPDPELVMNSGLLTAEEYFSKDVVEKAVKVTGKYTGWINPELVERYNLEMSAKDAWEKNGGGKFSFKDPLGTGKIRKSSIPAGVSEAKFVSSKMFKKNPNSYFYRNVEPGVDQWTGDWDNEEKEMFLKIASEFGCGDKWGLFSSYIPHRVGYQCSNYYRQYIIPQGLVIDPNYKFNMAGKAVYTGSHNRSR